ncbi:MAG TPA: flagellar export chaperone FliS [Thermotogota bacterium]|nr:flagellar export chaperone FliS [Thermotogota bacterium]HPJ88808.1 flagellar export chaperone FliS [Thermotogota bacterium]HPR96671.1 flagellar export chaperone FliS [Thermotogota bacterium]
MNQASTYGHLRPGIKKSNVVQEQKTEQVVVVKKNDYIEKAIETATPAKLVEMLYTGAINFLAQARNAIDASDISLANDKLVRVQDIIMELNISLDMEKGGEISKNLRGLYNYIYKRLLDANMKKDIKIIDEVSDYIKELRDTWIEAMKKEGSLAEKLPDPNRKRFDVAL